MLRFFCLRGRYAPLYAYRLLQYCIPTSVYSVRGHEMMDPLILVLVIYEHSLNPVQRFGMRLSFYSVAFYGWHEALTVDYAPMTRPTCSRLLKKRTLQLGC